MTIIAALPTVQNNTQTNQPPQPSQPIETSKVQSIPPPQQVSQILPSPTPQMIRETTTTSTSTVPTPIPLPVQNRIDTVASSTSSNSKAQ